MWTTHKTVLLRFLLGRLDPEPVSAIGVSWGEEGTVDVELLASLAVASVITDVGVTFSVLMHELELDPSANGNSGDSIRSAKFKKVAVDVDVVKSFTTHSVSVITAATALPLRKDSSKTTARHNPVPM